MAIEERAETNEQGFASIDSSCPHYFGYLRERAKWGSIPEECLACKKVVECMLHELKSPQQKPAMEQVKVTREEMVESLAQVTEETVEEKKEEVEEKIEPKAKIQPRVEAQPPEDHFMVKDMGMLYATWTSTVRIPKEILAKWGGKVKEVILETANGRKEICKVAPIEGLKERIVEVPDKVQQSLGVAKGDFIRVRPCL
ncbi:MAG: hypothetical protein RMJ15_02745 [Nitrososphaerota archaeon]|nr:hypothetical protein [Candidatus Bathyarchaeota archaeon]MDW8022649.1 hypothetical protein [Nitrososphaerota archaeon]